MELRPEDAPATMRRSQAAAMVGWLLAVTSLWLPWWRIRFFDPAGNRIDEATAGPFDPGQFATPAAVWVTTAVVLAVAVVLFVRIAGRSWLYEPRAWIRDVAVSAGMMLVAAVSAWSWPDGATVAPSFWGGVDFTTNGTADTFSVTTAPGLGWWVAVVAALLLGLSTWLATRSK